MKKQLFTTRRLVLDAVLIALYIVLAFFKIQLGNILRFNMASFAVVMCAVAFGPVDGLIVGFLGEFLAQILGPYGLTPTTVLWALPEAIRGGLLGLVIVSFKLMDKEKFVLFLVSCVVTGILASLANTFALYVDSKMFGYYTYVMVFGVLIWRVVIYVVLSGVFGYVSLPIISALRKAKFLWKREYYEGN
jgi:ECF transporter S component (folate family)